MSDELELASVSALMGGLVDPSKYELDLRAQDTEAISPVCVHEVQQPAFTLLKMRGHKHFLGVDGLFCVSVSEVQIFLVSTNELILHSLGDRYQQV
jgi:hypothetical protein